MSSLKYQTLEELKITKQECEKYISKLTNEISGQKDKLKWIDHYINQHSCETDDKKELVEEVKTALRKYAKENYNQKAYEIIAKYKINRLYQVKDLNDHDLDSILKDLRQNQQ